MVLASSAPARPPPDVVFGLVVADGQCGEQASDLGYGLADHHAAADSGSPFAVSVLATTSQACADIDKVMWAYQARQSPTWYSSRPAVFLASWKHSWLNAFQIAFEGRLTPATH